MGEPLLTTKGVLPETEARDPFAYGERASALDGATVWTKVADGYSSWILPDGCIDVIWDSRELMVAGPDTIAHRSHASLGTPYVALRFDSGVGPTVLGVAADGLRNARPRLADVLGRNETDRLFERLLAADDVAGELERWAARRLARNGGRDLRMCQAATLIAEGRIVSDVAIEVGLSERQLHRRSLASFGYGPKMLGRIARLQRGLDLARHGLSLAQTAVAAGYSDQAHFAHETLALTGQTASQLVGRVANKSTPLPSGSRNVA
jgi:AraC-like DNA-binding protein